MERSEVIAKLSEAATDFEESSPGGYDFIYAGQLSFNFGADGILQQICLAGDRSELSFQGITLGDQVGKLGETGHIVSVDYHEFLLVLRNTPGIHFNFEGDEDHYEGADEAELEGGDEALKNHLDPAFILQSKIDRICVSRPFESDSLFDLNA